MALWRLSPVAEADDASWQNRRIWLEVVVRANSPADARLIAAKLEIDPCEPPLGNESPSFRSGFLDEKLYRVDHAGGDEGAPEILKATEGRPAELQEL
jgi:hypothetical protein